MGCDIHCHVEVKINDKWRHYGKAPLFRFYDMFARMTNVHNYSDIEPISIQRMFPNDVTFITEFDSDRFPLDAYGHSWLNSQEIYDLVQWIEQNYYEELGLKSDWYYRWFGDLFGNPLHMFAVNKSGYPSELEDVRIVFYFEG